MPKRRNCARWSNPERSRNRTSAACHTIGGGAVNDPASGDIGPDLYAITGKRDLAWLRRFIAEPDRVLEEKDPLALSLLAKFNNIPMPNLRLNKLEIDSLIEYIELETRRLDQLQTESRQK